MVRTLIKGIIVICVGFLACVLCYFLFFKYYLCAERVEVTTERAVMDITETMIVDKYDYMNYNYRFTPEVYVLVIKGKDKDGKECKYDVRVTLATYLSSNIGDKFNMQEHMKR